MLNRAWVAAICGALFGLTAWAVETSESPWTDWYRKRFIGAVLTLSKMREHLEKNNIFDPYVSRPAAVHCGPDTLQARTIDGTCNDLEDSTMGAVGTRLGRNISLEASHPESEAGLFSPDPREISLRLLTRNEFQPATTLNLIAVGWVQFMIHDWFSHGDNEETEPFFLPLKPGDPLGQKDMLILRSQQDRSRTASERHLPPTYLNESTHWWDGSQLYGSDLRTSESLRTFRDGTLNIDERGRLPLGSDGIEIAGLTRNWWLGLSMMHHLFTQEHNAIAMMLKKKHPEWSDQQLFDQARLINAAVMAKIHTIEWTPALLGNPVLKQAMHANWYGLLNPTRKVHPFFEFLPDPVLFGIVGGKKDLNGVPYSMTEEFTSVYRMHPLLPEELTVRSTQDGNPLEIIEVGETRGAGSHAVTDRFEMRDLLYSAGRANPGALTLNNYPRFLQSLEVPIAGKIDLGTIDLFRDRERGIPRYNEFRRQLNLKPIRTFEDLTPNASVVQALKELYAGHVERLDLMIGCLAEAYRPYGYAFGETQFQVFIIMASRRLQADRFYTVQYDAKTYTREGLKWIEKAAMSEVLLRHHPELRGALRGIDNAFSPWNAQQP